MNIFFGDLLELSHVLLLMHTFRSQHVSAAQISPSAQSVFDEQSVRPPHAMLPSRQKPVPSRVLAQMHVLSPLQELNLPHDDREQFALLQTPFWQDSSPEHWTPINICPRHRGYRLLLCAHTLHSFGRLS